MRWATDDAAAGQFLVDLGDAAVLGVAEAADQGQDVEAELVVGQGEVGLGLGAVGPVVAGAVGVGAAADAQGEADDAVEGGDGAVFAVGGPKEMTALRAVSGDGCEGLGLRGARPATGARHGSPSSMPPSFYSSSAPSRPKFASLEKNRAARKSRAPIPLRTPPNLTRRRSRTPAPAT